MSTAIRITALAAAVAMLALAGCYEYEQDPAATQAPPAPASAPDPAAAGTTAGTTARPSHAGARQAARNTVDRIGERQQELDKALEDEQ